MKRTNFQCQFLINQMLRSTMKDPSFLLVLRVIMNLQFGFEHLITEHKVHSIQNNSCTNSKKRSQFGVPCTENAEIEKRRHHASLFKPRPHMLTKCKTSICFLLFTQQMHLQRTYGHTYTHCFPHWNVLWISKPQMGGPRSCGTFLLTFQSGMTRWTSIDCTLNTSRHTKPHSGSFPI